ncbi:MAG: ferredoxin [Candidatus Theseobacter exili]|nr:ferredoxin [Candidatus Theseobacter exili]
MKAVIDADLCIGCELCVNTCPEVFEMDGDKAKVIVAEVPADAEESCKSSIEDCPVDAIVAE